MSDMDGQAKVTDTYGEPIHRDLPPTLPLRRGALDIDPPVHFRERPVLLPVADRVVWRLSLLTLILHRFRGHQARVEHLHLLFWSLQTSTTRSLMSTWWAGTRAPDLATIRIEPRLEVTIALAVAEGIASVAAAGKVRLTEQGVYLARKIEDDDALMAEEKAHLTNLRPLNEASVLRHMGGSAA